MSAHYYKDGELVPEGTEGALPSVTTILSVRANPGLQEWRDRVGAEEAYRRQQESSELGTRVHKELEHLVGFAAKTDAAILLHEALEPIDTDPFVQGFVSWFNKYQPSSLLAETYLQSDLHEYCGTADLICMLDGEQWVIDFKTSKHIRPEYALQLAAYEQAWCEMGHGRSRRAVLQLTTEIKRGWRFKEFTSDDDFGVFMAHKEIFDWQQQFKSPRRDISQTAQWAFAKEEA